MDPVPCANTHNDVKDLVNHEMVKNRKNGTKSFYETKNFFSCASDDLSWEVIIL